MGRACNAHGEMRNTYTIWSEGMKGRVHLEDVGVNGMMDLRQIWWELVEWIHLTQGTDQWRGLVNTGMNLRVP